MWSHRPKVAHKGLLSSTEAAGAAAGAIQGRSGCALSEWTNQQWLGLLDPPIGKKKPCMLIGRPLKTLYYSPGNCGNGVCGPGTIGVLERTHGSDDSLCCPSSHPLGRRGCSGTPPQKTTANYAVAQTFVGDAGAGLVVLVRPFPHTAPIRWLCASKNTTRGSIPQTANALRLCL